MAQSIFQLPCNVILALIAFFLYIRSHISTVYFFCTPVFCLLRIFHVYSTSNDSRLTSWSCLSLQLHVEKDRSFQRYLANKETIITTVNYHPIDSLIVSFILYPTSSFCPPPLPHLARFFLISFFFSFLSLVCSSSRIPTTKARFD